MCRVFAQRVTYVIMYAVNMQIRIINILHLVSFGIENQQKHELDTLAQVALTVQNIHDCR